MGSPGKDWKLIIDESSPMSVTWNQSKGRFHNLRGLFGPRFSKICWYWSGPRFSKFYDPGPVWGQPVLVRGSLARVNIFPKPNPKFGNFSQFEFRVNFRSSIVRLIYQIILCLSFYDYYLKIFHTGGYMEVILIWNEGHFQFSIWIKSSFLRLLKCLINFLSSWRLWVWADLLLNHRKIVQKCNVIMNRWI